MSKIVRLTAENIKRLHAVTIEPDPNGNLIIVGGQNGQGKTSLLDSIAMALGGKDAVPKKPIREGEESAKVVLETEEYVITRKFTSTGSSLVVTTPEGARMPSPQALLDTLTAKVSFDPLAFTRMDADEQAEALRRLIGIDFAELDREAGEKYALRTGVNRSVRNQQAEVARLLPVTDAGIEFKDAATLGERMEAGAAVNTANEKARGKLDDWNDEIASTEAAIAKQAREVESLKKAVADAEKLLAEMQDDRQKAVSARDEIHKEITALVDVDLSVIRKEMDELNAHNEEVRRNLRRKEEAAKLRALETESKELTERLEGIEQEKARQLRKAKYPIAGLGFNAGGVTYNGIPFAQSSGAEQLRISMAMGAAMQPKLKVALIRDGSLLDDKSLVLLGESAEEYGVQVWLERVGEGKECSVIIEDGEIKK